MHSPLESASSPSASSSISPASFPSRSSTMDPTSYQPYASSSRHPNLPPPPPPDRLPPSKGRSTHHPGHRFKLRKGKEKGHRRTKSGPVQLDDEDWTFEGGPTNGTTTIAHVTDAERREVPSNGPSPPLPDVSVMGESMFDSQLTEIPAEKKEKKSKGRQLVKKTSRLFLRDREREKSGDGRASGSATPDSSASLHVPTGSRQPSYSSAYSTDSMSTDGSSRHPFTSLQQTSSNHLRSRSPNPGHARRLSQDSQASWQAASRSVRSGSSVIDSPIESTNLPTYPRQNANLSASVPTLFRQALPQPGLGSAPDASGAIPSRMSSWFSHLLPSSSAGTVATPPINISSSVSSSPRKGPSAAATFLNAARQRAVDGVRHLLDTEAQPDKCPDIMWVMGVGHPGYRSGSPLGSPSGDSSELPDVENRRRGSGSSGRPSPPMKGEVGALRPAAWRRKEAIGPTSPPSKGFGNLFSSSTTSLAIPASTAIGSPSKDTEGRGIPIESPSKGKKAKGEKEILRWPEQFYDDFRSRVWCTYRSQYAPIISLPSDFLVPSPEAYFSAFGPPADVCLALPQPGQMMAGSASQRPSTAPWGWSKYNEERGLTSDAGWGCMLRTGQSMLANALIHLHLGRAWRVPTRRPSSTPQSRPELLEFNSYATYVRLLSWFLDDPSPLCPFSVHRMALIGKEHGKEVGEWFGPSTAAGALKTLANSFPLCGLSVATATDSMIYKSDIYAASQLSNDGWIDDDAMGPSRRGSNATRKSLVWGGRAVLILVGVRLGLDGVNPIYHESVKALFTFPQSVGIAGGRPSSSYYFVASQANFLFYLDPHLTRPAIPMNVPPAPATRDEAALPHPNVEGDEEPVAVATSAGSAYTLDVVDVDDISDDDTSDADSPLNRARRATRSSPVTKRLSAPTAPSALNGRPTPATPPVSHPRRAPSDPFGDASSPSPQKTPTRRTASQNSVPVGKVDPQTVWYANAYPEAALRTFHCDKVKKMPISSLDPSMLLGFLIEDEAEFDDFCVRVGKLPQKIFTVQDEPPSWDEDDAAGLESVSEPDLDEMADDMEGTNLNESELGSVSAADPSSITVSGADKTSRFQQTSLDDWETKLETASTPPGQSVLVDPFEAGPTKRPQSRPLGRSDTESWVRPEREGEAPNGENVL